MLGAIDITEFTTAATDIGTAVGAVGAATVGVYVATKAFPFAMAWIGKLFRAGRGGAGA